MPDSPIVFIKLKALQVKARRAFLLSFNKQCFVRRWLPPPREVRRGLIFADA